MTWDEAAEQLRDALLSGSLLRAVASDRDTRVTIRPIEVKTGPALQIVVDEAPRPTTKTHPLDTPEAAAAIDALLASAYRNWHVETAEQTLRVQVSKKGKVLLSRGAPPERTEVDRSHDRAKRHVLDPGDPLFDVIGGDARKRRQVDAFLRALDATLPADLATAGRPLRVVDLGCGNAYLSFAAYHHLTKQRGLDVRLTGVDVREDQRERNTALARELGFTGVDFLAGTILAAPVPEPVDLVLALHACDTATDEALARAVGWDARWILAAPCCHKDISRQLRAGGARSSAAALTRSGILRERFADVLTDALRAAILRQRGYAVEVVEFVDSAHTPRNLLLRATKAGNFPPPGDDDYEQLVGEWGVRPHLTTLLA
ncbi:MAG: SAM-dependent methyltransferase [Hamadaea sp.]|nr:SAM-dependent methyltransferase [Hamadaea sp.]